MGSLNPWNNRAAVAGLGQLLLSLGEPSRTWILHTVAAEGDDDHVRALLTSSFFVVEAVAGVTINARALLSVAGHMLTDVIGWGRRWRRSIDRPSGDRFHAEKRDHLPDEAAITAGELSLG